MADKIATREAYGKALAEFGAIYENLVVLDADLAAATKTGTFKKAFPERHFDCGIAENNMICVATGMSLCGKIPFASSFAMFAAGRSFEQIRNSIGYPHNNVKIGATHAGITVGEDGATHQCCEDIALMRTIPGMVIINPADAAEARLAVKAAIEKVHSWGKPIRFWEAPEGTTAYFTFWKMGVDIINTDKPAVASLFFSDWGNKNFIMGKHQVQAGVTGTKKLDAATRDFSGFQNEKLQLTRRIPTYTPTYRNDGSSKKIKNVIFLIGDGMGLNQIVAGAYANNRDLSILKMKSIGIQFYNPQDDFIGDSASGGSALATGELSWTRHIASNHDGSVEYPSLADYFKEMGKATGVVSLGDIADATPAVFYGHTSERDSTDRITRYML